MAAKPLIVRVPLLEDGEFASDIETFEVHEGDMGDLYSQLRQQPNAPMQDVQLQRGGIVIALSDRDPTVEGLHAIANTAERWIDRRTPYDAGNSYIEA